jgi:hypothetical protein
MINYTLNQNTLFFDLSDFDSYRKGILSAFLVIFNMSITILMLNLIIAMMGNTYNSNDAPDDDRKVLNRERYNIMCEQERGLTIDQKSNLRKYYTLELKDPLNIKNDIWFEYYEKNNNWKKASLSYDKKNDIKMNIKHTLETFSEEIEKILH